MQIQYSGNIMIVCHWCFPCAVLALYGVPQSDRVNDLCDFQYNQYKFLSFNGNFPKQNTNQIYAGYLKSSWQKNPI